MLGDLEKIFFRDINKKDIQRNYAFLSDLRNSMCDAYSRDRLLIRNCLENYFYIRFLLGEFCAIQIIEKF